MFKEGHGNGFQHYSILFPKAEKGIMIMTNSDNGFPLIHEIIRAISKEYDWPAMWMRE